MRIQEIAEELVNLSVKEVNELSMVLKNDFDIPQVQFEETPNNHTLSPKEYGIKKLGKRKR
jgi:ribosomal protein L7/L12